MRRSSLLLLLLPIIVGGLYLLTLPRVATSGFAWAALGIAAFGILLVNVREVQKVQAGGWALYAGGIAMFMQFTFNIVSQLTAGTVMIAIVLIAVIAAESPIRPKQTGK